MVTNRELKKTEKKQRIQEAAIKVMAANGFYGTTVSQIAKEARVADGTLYLYFENKDDLLIGIFEEIMDKFIADGLETLRQVKSPLDRLIAIAEMHLSSLGSDRALTRIFQIELRHNVKIMKRLSETKLREYFTVIENVIKDAQQAQQIRGDVNPWMAVKILFGALDEMATNWLLSNKDYDLKQMAKPTLDIVLRGMCTPNAK